MNLAIFIACMGGLAHGFNEGIDMHQPNPRNHKWYGIYHRVWVIEACLIAWFGYYMIGQFGWWILPALMLANRFFEVMYGFVRFNNPLPEQENFLGLSLVMAGWRLSIVRAGLWFVGLAWWIRIY